MRPVRPWNSIAFRLWVTLTPGILLLILAHQWFERHDGYLDDIARERARQIVSVLNGRARQAAGSAGVTALPGASGPEGPVPAGADAEQGPGGTPVPPPDAARLPSCMPFPALFRTELAAWRADSTLTGVVLYGADGGILASETDEGAFRPCERCHLPGSGPPRSTYRLSAAADAPVLAAVRLGEDPACGSCHVHDRTHSAALHLSLVSPVTDLVYGERRARMLRFEGAVLLVAVSLLAVLLHVQVRRPLQRLLAGARRLERGGHRVRTGVDGSDELGRLGRAFDAMAARLDDVLSEQERTIHEQARRLAESQARILHQEKLAGLGVIAAGVAHEIGNPLSSISAVAQLLGRRSTDDFTRQQVKLILTHIQRISRIVQDLSDFARPPSLEPRSCRVDEVLRAALNLLRYDTRFRGVRIVEEFDPRLPAVHLVPDHLLQVFFNLALNAMEAMEGKGTLLVEARGEDGVMVVRFRDDGPGVAEAERSRIFDPFFTTKPRGTGLGLSVSYGLAQSLGGTIELEDGSERGACFRVVLPVSVSDGRSMPAPPARPEGIASPPDPAVPSPARRGGNDGETSPVPRRPAEVSGGAGRRRNA